MDAFLKYLDENGAYYKKCKVVFGNPYYRYIVANDDIKENEEVITIPSKLIMWDFDSA